MICDQTIELTGLESLRETLAPVRRIAYRDALINKRDVFLPHQSYLAASTIASIYLTTIATAFRLAGHLHDVYGAAVASTSIIGRQLFSALALQCYFSLLFAGIVPQSSQITRLMNQSFVSRIGVFLLFALVLPVFADAQEPGASSDGAQEAAELVESIKHEFDAMVALRKVPEGESQEARELRTRRLADEELRVGSLIHDLAELVVENDDDASIEAARKQVVAWLRQLPRDVSDVIERREKLLAEAKKERDDARPEGALEAEERVTRASHAVDEALQYFAQQLQLLDKLQIDAAAAREGLLERLQERAGTVAARVRVTRDSQEQLAEIIAESPGDSATKRRSLQLDERLEASVESLRLLTAQLRSLDADTTEYQKLLVQVTGDVTDIGLSTSVLSGLAVDGWRKSLDWLEASGPRLLGKVLLVLFILVVSGYLARLARRVVNRAFAVRPGGTSLLLRRTAAKFAGQLILVLGFLVALSQLGVSVGPMLAGLGIAGFVIGFALQDTLSNFASGAFILFYRPFDVGDVVEAGGVTGKVQAMNLVSSTILTFDNQTLIVPNQKIWGDVIRNVSTQLTRRVDLTFGIGYDDDIEKAEGILHEVVEGDERVLPDPAPVIRLAELADSSVNFVVRPWVRRDDYWDVYWDMTRTVKLRFDAEGITIPYPQRDVHLHYAEQLDSAADRRARGGSPSPNQLHAPTTGVDEDADMASVAPQN